MSHPVIAISGSTGVVGSEMISIIEELRIPFRELRLLASEGSTGEVYGCCGREFAVEKLDDAAFKGVDLALFATNAELAARFVPIAVESGALVIDNSSHFRMHSGVPLIVPEVNASALTKEARVISNPNCSTIQLVPVLNLIHQAAGLKRVVVSTYQSVSGAGKHALDELWAQTLGIFNQKEVEPEAFRHQIAFNCIPQIDLFLEDGYTKEEQKIIRESRKILGLTDLQITATAVRVPVFHCHAESVNIETEREFLPERAIDLFADAPGIEVARNPEDFPMQVQVAGTNSVYVGRVRRDRSVRYGLDLWIVADNLRKGAALNAVQIYQAWREKFGELRKGAEVT